LPSRWRTRDRTASIAERTPRKVADHSLGVGKGDELAAELSVAERVRVRLFASPPRQRLPALSR
jgi:hypothetical protein